MSKKISLSELSAIIKNEYDGKKGYIYHWENQELIDDNIRFSFLFYKIDVRPDRNELWLTNGVNYICIKNIQEVIIRNSISNHSVSINLLSRNLTDKLNPIRYTLLVG